MLQLQTKSNDVCRISKLLAKYNVKASITDEIIILYSDFSDELLSKLCEVIDINTVQNFIGEISVKTEKKEKAEKRETLPYNTLEYDLIFPEVKRGEVYVCDFGMPYGSEQGEKRYAIVVQNDKGNLYSPTTIVIACACEQKKRLPVHYHSDFSLENMIDYDFKRVTSGKRVIMAEQIRTVDKRRLRKYVGMLIPEFMEKIDRKIEVALQLNKEEKTIVKKEVVYDDIPTSKNTTVNPSERKYLNMIQIQLLSLIDINELFKISKSYSNDEVKAKRILDLYGFDFKKNGVQYLLKAIIISPKYDYFNLETLSEFVSKEENINKEEIKRLIVARVKETIGFKKAPTIDFIRLVNNFLLKQED